MRQFISFSVCCLLGFASLTSTATASEEFDACVRKLCVSTNQGDCWIKAGADLCKKPGKQCSELEDHTGAKVIRKTGKFWEMETGKGTGFINERFMMVSGDLC